MSTPPEHNAHCARPEGCLLRLASGTKASLYLQELQRGFNGQWTWAHLPQGFKNSPIIFDESPLHEDLGECRRAYSQVTLLQYIDDFRHMVTCLRPHQALLQEQSPLGYRVSAKKAQLCHLSGVHTQGEPRHAVGCLLANYPQHPRHIKRKESAGIGGSARFCRL